jgi:hypothetical protein
MNFNFSNTTHIDDFKWQKRILIINDNQNYFHIKIKGQEKEFIDRDIEIINISNNKMYFSSELITNSLLKSISIRFGYIKKDTILLIGKDGYLKNIYPLSVETEKIYCNIDKMPMRKFEKKKKWLKNYLSF